MTALDGKHVFITGGSMGIGKAAARICLEDGARITICARTEGPLAQARTELESGYAGNVTAFAADISSPQSVEAAFDAAAAAFGELNGVIHAAAVIGPIGPIVDVDCDAWLNALKIDLFGTFVVVREACRRMKAGGRIAVFSGGGAATPFPNYSAYAASKAGVVRFVETVAHEMAPRGIEINAVGPGFVITRFHDATLAAGEAAGRQYLERTKREIEKGGVSPDVGARCAAFLVSDKARGITGKFVAAPYDEYATWLERDAGLRESDLFTLRRIVPRDRGMDWQ